MKWRAFGRMPQWVRLSEWLGISGGARIWLNDNMLTDTKAPESAYYLN
jgi:hypothetical protein